MSIPQDLEPAVRDPKKLRRTAWILVGMMILGGWLIFAAYNKWASQRAGDDRPSIVHRIQPERSLRVVRQDGKTADLMDLRGKVFAIHVVHLDQPDDAALSLQVLKRVAETYRTQEDFRVVTLVLDPGPAEGLVDKLKAAAAEMEVTLPQWWVGSTEPNTLADFIRKELKPSVPPEKVEGSWKFDPSVTLVDRNGHIRRAVVPQKIGGKPYIATFDFDQAAQWDEQRIKTGTQRNNQEQLEHLLGETIDKLLLEKIEQKSPWPGLVGGVIVLLLIGSLLFLKIFRSKSAPSRS